MRTLSRGWDPCGSKGHTLRPGNLGSARALTLAPGSGPARGCALSLEHLREAGKSSSKALPRPLQLEDAPPALPCTAALLLLRPAGDFRERLPCKHLQSTCRPQTAPGTCPGAGVPVLELIASWEGTGKKQHTG